MQLLKNVMQGWLKNTWEEYFSKQFLRGAYGLAQQVITPNYSSQLESLEAIHGTLHFSERKKLVLFAYFKLVSFFALEKYALASHEANLLFTADQEPCVKHLAGYWRALAHYRLHNHGKELSLEAYEMLGTLQADLEALLACFAHFESSDDEQIFFRECVSETHAEAQFLIARLYFIMSLLPVNEAIKGSLSLKALAWLNAALCNQPNESMLWVALAFALRARLRLECYGQTEAGKAQADLQKAERLFRKSGKKFPFQASKEQIASLLESNKRKLRPSKAGYVYVMAYSKAPNLRHYKIGCSRRPLGRTKYLATHSSFPARLIHLIKCQDMSKAEAYFHARFRSKRLNGEWFELDSADLAYIKSFSQIKAIPKALMKSIRSMGRSENLEV